MPDALVFAAAVPRLLGARVLLDLHECMPEFFSVKYGVGPAHPALRLLAAAEQMSIRFADRVITCTEEMRETFVRRGADPEQDRRRPQLGRREHLRRPSPSAGRSPRPTASR